MAAQLAPTKVRWEHQRLHHFVADAAWDDAAVLAAVRDYVLAETLPGTGQAEALLIDDTGFPKQGRHSVGVARQYCGQLGKQDNCQVAVSISAANEAFSLPVAYRPYLPEEWAADVPRRKQGKVPAEIAFATKPALALELLAGLSAAMALPDLVVADAGYGVNSEFRQGMTRVGFRYVVGTTGAVKVWPQGHAPLPPAPWSGQGRKPKLLRRDADHQPVSVKALARQLSGRRYRTVTWREGINNSLSSRFAAVRVRSAHRGYWRAELPTEQWLLIEWPSGEPEPTKYFLSTLPATTPLKELVRLAKLRCRIERDYQELKQELGLGHFEGRSWRGYHLHATLCIASYAFLLSQRLTVPKKSVASRSRRNPCLTPRLPAPGLPCAGSVTYWPRSRPCASNLPPP